MSNKNSIKIFIIIALLAILGISLLYLFVPNDFRNMTTTEVNKYKCVWAFLGIGQLVFTAILVFLIMSVFLKNSTAKLKSYLRTTLLFGLVILWLYIVLPPVYSVMRKPAGLKDIKVTEVGRGAETNQADNEN